MARLGGSRQRIAGLVAATFTVAGIAGLLVVLFGGGKALAGPPVTVAGGSAACPVPVSRCTYGNVTSTVSNDLATNAGLAWTLNLPGLPSLVVSGASVSTDSTNYSMTLSGTFTISGLGTVPMQANAVWSNSSADTNPQLTLAVQPAGAALSALAPQWSGSIDPNLSHVVLVTSPQSGTFQPSVLPNSGSGFYPAGMSSLAVGTGVSIYAGVDTTTISPALANALSYLGLGSDVSLSGILSTNLNPLVDPSAAGTGIDLTIAASGTGSLPSWVTSRTASLEFTDTSSPGVTLKDVLATSINGASNTFTGTAAVSASSFGGAQVDVSYSVSGSGFQAPFGLGKLALSGTELDLAFTTGGSPSFAASLKSTVTVNSTPLTLAAKLSVGQGGTVDGTFSLGGAVDVPDAVSIANSLLATSVSLPSGSTGSTLTLRNVTFSFATQSGDDSFALSARTTLGSADADVLVALDDNGTTPKLFAGLHFANLDLSSLVSGTSASADTAGLSFTSLDAFASTGYLSNGKPTSVGYSDLLPAEQAFFDQVYGGNPPASVSFGPTLSVDATMALPSDVAGPLGISAPLTLTGELGFGLDSVDTASPPALGGDLSVTVPALTSGLPSWLQATGPATLTLSADSAGNVALNVADTATATISGASYDVSLAGSFSHTGSATKVALTGSLTGTFTGLFGQSWLSLTNPAVRLDLAHSAGQTTAGAAVTGDVTVGGYQLSASLKLSGGSSGATVTLDLHSVDSTATLDAATAAEDLGVGASYLSGLPTVSLTSLQITGTASTSAGESLDLLASTAVSFPGASAPLDSQLLLSLRHGGGNPTSVLAGFKLSGSTTLADILPAGDVPGGADFTLPQAAVLLADPATTLHYAALDKAEQGFFAPFCGDSSSACSDQLSVPSGASLVSAFAMPSDMTDMISKLAIPVPSGDVLLTGTVPVFGSGSLELSVTLPKIVPTGATPDFFHSGQLSFDISLAKGAPSMSLAGTAAFNIPKGSVPQGSCASEGGVWRTPRGGGAAACYDQVPFSITASVQLAPVSITLTGALAGPWQAPMGADWLTLNTAALQIGFSSTPTPGGTVGIALGVTIEGHDFSGAIDASVEVGPTGLDPNIIGFRLASGTGLSMADIVSLGNAAFGTSYTLDSAKIPNLAVRNILLSYSEANDPQLCLPLGLHIAGDLYVNPGADALTVSPDAGCANGTPDLNRAAICQKDSAEGCLAGVDVKVDSSGITASGLVGAFTAGPLAFQGAEVDLAINASTQHLVVAGGLSVSNFLSGSADLLISPTKLQFRGSADVFGSGLQAYLDGSASANVTSLKSIQDVASFNVTAVLQTTFLHQAEVAIAGPLEKLRPVLQIVDNMIVDANNGDVLEALTTLPTELANSGESLPSPYGAAFTEISDTLGQINSDLAKADQASSVSLNMVLNGTKISTPGVTGKYTPGFCITHEVDGKCYTTPPVNTVFGTVPGIPGTWVPPTCVTTVVNGTCYAIPPFSVTIPGICNALQSLLNNPNLSCTSQGIFDDLITPVLRSAIQQASGYDIGNLDLTTFLNDVNNALTSGDIFNLSCAQFQAAATVGSAPSADVSLAADGDVLSYPFNLGLGWNFAPQGDSVSADVSTLLQDLIHPQTGGASCGLPANWNANPDFPGISGSVNPDSGVGTSGGSGTANTPPPPSMSVHLARTAITEGSAATLTGAVTPAPSSAQTISISWGDGSASQAVRTAPDGTFTATHAFPDLSPTGAPSAKYLVAATDSADSLSANASLTVDDAVPGGLTVTGPGRATPIGTPVVLSGSFVDPAGEPHVVTADWADGTTSSITLPAGATTFSGLSHTYLDEDTADPGSGTYPVRVTVSDDGSASTSTTVPVTVVDVAPSKIRLVPLSASGAACPTCALTTPEQQPAGFQVSFDYPSVTDQLTATIDWGDGTTPLQVPLAPDARTLDVSHLWTEADPPAHPHGRFPITITITDGDGLSGVASPVETVTNVAPTDLTACLPLAGSTTSDTACPTSVTEPEGSSIDLFGSFSDPSALDTHTVTIDWGPGWPQASRVQTIQLGVGDFQYEAARVYGDEGTYPVTVTVTDDDGASVRTTSTVHITNVAPTVAISGQSQTVVQGVPAYLSRAGSPVSMNASASDPGNDPLALLWAFGDGASAGTVIPPGADPADAIAPENPTPAPVSGTYPVTHAWAKACVYGVGFSATDADGAVTRAGTDAVVTGTSAKAWQAGYWASRYRAGLTPGLACDLQIVARMSAVFAGPSSVVPGAPVPLTSAADTLGVLQPESSSARAMLRREILTLWLDYAGGAFTYGETVHPSSAPASYTPTFGVLMNSAEATALDPGSSRAALDRMRRYLDGLIGQ